MPTLRKEEVDTDSTRLRLALLTTGYEKRPTSASGISRLISADPAVPDPNGYGCWKKSMAGAEPTETEMAGNQCPAEWAMGNEKNPKKAQLMGAVCT